MERRGSGFKKIIGAYQAESQKRNNSRSPEFRSTAKNFFVIMPNLNYGTNLVGGKKNYPENYPGKYPENYPENYSLPSHSGFRFSSSRLKGRDAI